MTPPVLFLIFNRPDLTERVFSRIRDARPPRLFLAADGPREGRPNEPRLCQEARRVAERVDWPCDVQTLFRDENLGCRRAVGEAVTWFFEHVEEGVVLEDDCLPDPSFFRYCGELLERYRDDERVMCVSGANFQQGRRRGEASYYFSIYNHCWGWASWRRAWRAHDAEMRRWPELRGTRFLKDVVGTARAARYWRKQFDRVVDRRIDTWDYAWTLSCWVHGGLTALPNANLVSNIGFDDRATHTLNANSPDANAAAAPLAFPLGHPGAVQRDAAADAFTQDFHHLPRKPRFLQPCRLLWSDFRESMRRAA